MARSLLSCKVIQLFTRFYFSTLVLSFKTIGNFDTDFKIWNLPFCSSLILINLNNFFISSGILTSNCVHSSRPYSWFHFCCFSRQTLKWSVSANKGTVSFCVGAMDERALQMQSSIIQVLQRYMTVLAAGWEKWRGNMSQQCEAWLFNTCSSRESWRTEEKRIRLSSSATWKYKGQEAEIKMREIAGWEHVCVYVKPNFMFVCSC